MEDFNLCHGEQRAESPWDPSAVQSRSALGHRYGLGTKGITHDWGRRTEGEVQKDYVFRAESQPAKEKSPAVC